MLKQRLLQEHVFNNVSNIFYKRALVTTNVAENICQLHLTKRTLSALIQYYVFSWWFCGVLYQRDLAYCDHSVELACCCILGDTEPIGVFHQDDSSDLTYGKLSVWLCRILFYTYSSP